MDNPNSLCNSPKILGVFHWDWQVQCIVFSLLFRFYQRSYFGLSFLHQKSRGSAAGGVDLSGSLSLNHLLILFFCTGRKGGHKGRARQYTSPEEIDAQLQAEKQKARVCVCLRYVLTVINPGLCSMLNLQFMRNGSLVKCCRSFHQWSQYQFWISVAGETARCDPVWFLTEVRPGRPSSSQFEG